jgi:hypothetical protein
LTLGNIQTTIPKRDHRKIKTEWKIGKVHCGTCLRYRYDVYCYKTNQLDQLDSTLGSLRIFPRPISTARCFVRPVTSIRVQCPPRYSLQRGSTIGPHNQCD